MNIIKAIKDPNLFAPWFKNSSWGAWLVFLKSLFALPMQDGERGIFEQHTGRQASPSTPVREAWVIAGRRGGKSLIAAFCAVYLAAFRDYSKFLAPGEVGTLMLIAMDRRQARVVMRYIVGFLEGIPMLKSLIVRQTRESIELSNRIIIEIHSCSFRAVRGYTLVGCVCDEIAFWRSDESANPDVEILNGIRPGMATVPGSLLLCISSPHARRGELWNTYQKYYGKDSESILVWKAATREMNPSVPQELIDEALERDEPAARAEWLAEFRSDVETYISRESLQAAIIPHRVELPYSKQFEYRGFCDPSGGQADSMTLGISHLEGDHTVLDLVKEIKAPFSPDLAVQQFAAILRAYRITSVVGDKYAGQWPRERFRHYGINYDVSEQVKSELYRLLLPEINSGKVELLDNPRLINQLLQLERRTASGGKETIDHAPGSHDDVANAAAGACYLSGGFGGPSGGVRKLTGF